MDAAAVAGLIRLAVFVGEALRGAVVAEAVDLGHVLGRHDTTKLGALAGGPSGEGHREVHDETLQARPLHLAHDPPSGPSPPNPQGDLRLRTLAQNPRRSRNRSSASSAHTPPRGRSS